MRNAKRVSVLGLIVTVVIVIVIVVVVIVNASPSGPKLSGQ